MPTSPAGGSLLAGCHLLSLHGFQGARHSPHGMGVMHAPDNALQISTTTANTNTSSASLAHSTSNFLPTPFTTAKVNSPPEAATGAESAAHSGMPPSTFTHGQGTLGGWSVKSLPHPALLAPLAAVLAAINAGPPSLSQPASSAAAGVSSAFSSGAIPGAGGGVGGGGLHTCSVVAVAGGACVDVRKCELQGLTRSGGVTVGVFMKLNFETRRPKCLALHCKRFQSC